MKPRQLGPLLMLGCAAGQRPAPVPDAPADSGQVADVREGTCERSALVTVHVQNRSSMDVEITFGSYTAARAAPGLTRTTYSVPRTHLGGSIRLRIMRGGLQTGAPPRVPTEAVDCNDATLIIGAQPQYSFFYGEELRALRSVRDPD